MATQKFENPRHVEVAKNLVKQAENGLPINITNAVEEAGYEHGSRHIVRTEDFQKILWREIPFEMIAGAQKRQISAWKPHEFEFEDTIDDEEIKRIMKENELPVIYIKKGSGVKIVTVKFPEWRIIDSTIDKLFKIGGLYSAEKTEVTIKQPLEEKTDEELQKMVNSVILTPESQPQATIIDITPT